MEYVRLTCLVACLLAMVLGTASNAQIVPGQLPPAPPPQPGQLADEPSKPADPKPAEPGKEAPGDAPTFRKPSEKPDFTSVTRRVVVPTTVLDPDGHGYVTGLGAKDF